LRQRSDPKLAVLSFAQEDWCRTFEGSSVLGPRRIGAASATQSGGPFTYFALFDWGIFSPGNQYLHSISGVRISAVPVSTIASDSRLLAVIVCAVRLHNAPPVAHTGFLLSPERTLPRSNAVVRSYDARRLKLRRALREFLSGTTRALLRSACNGLPLAVRKEKFRPGGEEQGDHWSSRLFVIRLTLAEEEDLDIRNFITYGTQTSKWLKTDRND
jgi:hypothetical protein